MKDLSIAKALTIAKVDAMTSNQLLINKTKVSVTDAAYGHIKLDIFNSVLYDLRERAITFLKTATAAKRDYLIIKHKNHKGNKAADELMQIFKTDCWEAWGKYEAALLDYRKFKTGN